MKFTFNRVSWTAFWGVIVLTVVTGASILASHKQPLTRPPTDPLANLTAQCFKFQEERDQLKEVATLEAEIIQQQAKVIEVLQAALIKERSKNRHYSNIVDRL